MKHFLLMTILLLGGMAVLAQQDSLVKRSNIVPEETEIRLKNGSVLRGTMIRSDDSTYTLQENTLGVLHIRQQDIMHLRTGRQHRYYNGLPNRYLLTASAISMKKGEGYFQSVYTLLSGLYAVNDHVTVGGGVESFTLLSGKPVGYLLAKAGVSLNPNVHVAAGFLHLNYALFNTEKRDPYWNVPIGIVTLGNERLNVSGSMGRNITDLNGKYVYAISAYARLDERVAIVSENWIFGNSGERLFSGSVRIIGERNLFDLGLLTNSEIAQVVIGIPFIGYTYRF